jgi:multiple sugar transport system permease protein
MTQGLARKLITTAVVWTLLLLLLLPLMWMILTAFRPTHEIMRIPPSIVPSALTLEHVEHLLRDTPFLTYFGNSLIIASATTGFVVLLGTLAAYSLARFRYPGRETLAVLVLCSYLLPSVVLIIPVYLLMVGLGLANSYAGLVLAYATFTLPYALWLLRSFMAGIPDDLEHAALVDGASRIGAFVDIILPQALPGIISTKIFTFILSWNEYLFAQILIGNDEMRPLTTGVMNMLITSYTIEWSLLMAASVMMSVPLIIVFALLQRFLTTGFGAGAVKG